LTLDLELDGEDAARLLARDGFGGGGIARDLQDLRIAEDRSVEVGRPSASLSNQRLGMMGCMRTILSVEQP